MKYVLAFSTALASMSFFACSSDSTSSPSKDAGVTDGEGVDTGAFTTRPDAASDDSGSVADTGTSQDTGTGTDGAVPACTADFAGCVEADAGVDGGAAQFVDNGAADAMIDFGGSVGLAYSPKCLKIKAGQKVMWMGDFSFHPLSPAACNPSGGDTIPATSSGTSTTVTFTKTGTYGYYCQVHGAPGGSASAMNGVIVVY